MNKRKTTQGQQNYYETKKQDTLNRIRSAIKDMKEFDETVTKSKIMEMAGVSSGTLSKPYVLDLLREEHVCQFQTKDDSKPDYYSDSLPVLRKELDAMKKKNKSLDAKLAAMTKQRDSYAKKLKDCEHENSRLRGQTQMLLERLDSAGLTAGNIRLIK